MKIVHTIILILIAYSVTCQTYYKLYNFGMKDNFMVDMKISDNTIHVGIKHICDPDTTDNRTIQCLGYSSLTKEGNTINHQVMDSFFAIGNNSLLVAEEKVLVSSHEHDIGSGRPVVIHDISNSLTHQIFTSEIDYTYDLIGLNEFGQNIYFSGVQYNTTNPESNSSVQKLDKNFNIIWSTNYAKGKVRNGCFSLQPSADGDLVFIHLHDDGPGSQSNSGIQIVKLDTNGVIQDTVDFDEHSKVQRLLASRAGPLYFYTRSSLLNNDPDPYAGRLNKISLDLDSVHWSIGLKRSSFTVNRSYKIYDIQEAKNGDILAVGDAWDEGADGPLALGHNHNWNGFAMRVSPDGEVLWMRIYQQPNVHPLLQPIAEYGGYQSGRLNKIHELDDGHFIVGGTTYYDGQQQSVLFPLGKTTSYIWLMNIDENGCLDGEECSENIILDGVYKPIDDYLPYINDNTWYVHFSSPSEPPSSGRYTYSLDSVWEQGWYHEKLYSSNEDGSDARREGLYLETAGKVFKKTGPAVKEERLIFDITMVVGDTIELLDDTLVAISTDTVQYADGVDRKRIVLTCVNNPDIGIEVIWVEGIGDVSVTENYCSIDNVEGLTCYVDDEQVIYHSQWSDNCWLDPPEYDFLDFNKYWINYSKSVDNQESYLMKIQDGFYVLDNDKRYHQVLFTYEEHIPDWQNSEVYLREEGDSIWQYSSAGEFLLYDFSLMKGDTFDVTLKDESKVKTVVNEVDTMTMLDESRRKVILFNPVQGEIYPFGDITWIEGIGSTSGLLKHNGFRDATDTLVCHGEFNFVYQNSEYSSCWIVATEDLINEEVSIYPNPVSRQLFITTDAQITDIVIRSFTGDVVFVGPYSETLDIEFLLSGLYFIELTDVDNRRLYIKFIKL